MTAVQTCICSALALVPTKVLMRRFCLSALKKQFDSPALTVDGGDGGGGKVAMIGEEDQGALLGFVPDLDAAQEQIALAVCRASLYDMKMISSRCTGATLGDGTTFHHAVVGVVLHAGDEVDAVGIERARTRRSRCNPGRRPRSCRDANAQRASDGGFHARGLR